jgi:hypothetical protein
MPTVAANVGCDRKALSKRRSVSRVIIACVLVAAALGKLIDADGFARMAVTVAHVSYATGERLASLAVAFDLLLAAWLVSDWAPKLALLTSLIFFVAGAVLTSTLFVRHPETSCGCGLPAFGLRGRAEQGVGLGRNLALGGVALVGVFSERAFSRRGGMK